MSFGMMEAMLSFLRRQVGLRTDAADPAGSLHAKVKDIKDNVLASVNSNINTRQKPRGPVSGYGSYYINSTTYVTALNITGKGELIAIGVTSGSSAGAPTVKITVDGVVVAEAAGAASTAMQVPTGIFFLPTMALSTSGSVANGRIPFKSSLKIEAESNYGGNVYWLYVLE